MQGSQWHVNAPRRVAKVCRRCMEKFGSNRMFGHPEYRHHRAPYLPVRAVPGLPLGGVRGGRLPGSQPSASGFYWACSTFRRPGSAGHGAEFHDCSIPGHCCGYIVRDQRCGQAHFASCQCLCRQCSSEEEPGMDPPDVGVDYRLPLPKGKCRYGGCGVASNTGKPQELLVACGHLAIMAGADFSCRCV